MQIVLLFLLSVLCPFLIMPSTVLSEGQAGFTIGMRTLAAYTYWENNYSKERFDNIGPGLFITPKIKKRFSGGFIAIDMTFSLFHFNGPDGLTITGPDNDIDTGFSTGMSRRDLLLMAGYDFMEFFSLSVNLKHKFLKLHGDHQASGALYEYLEKGFLLGPALQLRLPLKKPILFVDLSYLAGYLNTNYLNNSITTIIRENQINTRLFLASLGVLMPLGKTLKLGISYEAAYQSRSAKSSIYRFYYNPTDSWFHGLAATVSRDF